MDGDKYQTMDALLAAYVAGTLPRPIEALVASHLELSPASRALVRALECCAGAALESCEPLDLPARGVCLKSVLSSSGVPVAGECANKKEKCCRIMPRALSDFVGCTLDAIPWKTKMPGLREYDMGEIEGFHVFLLWMQPGRKIPSHTHEGMELIFVIDGAFTDSTGQYRRGDVSIADEATDHRPIADAGGPCIAFVVMDGAALLTGPLHRRIADIIGVT